jgi:pSer/pThr/pTyr-binding forkhead associated (FHA) protein
MPDLTFVERRPNGGREHEVAADATVGREGCDIVLPDPEVSRRHATLRVTAQGPAVEDLGSTNGTFVNDRRIQGLVQLNDGDVVRFGNTEWQLRVGAPAGVGGVQVTAARTVPPPPPAAAPPQPATAAQPPAPAAPAPPATAAQPPAQAAPPSPEPVPTAGAAGAPRGDVPAPPEITPSAIRRTLPAEAAQAAPAFAPVGTRQIRGSAATYQGYTLFCYAVFLLTLAGVGAYFILN